MPLYDPLTFYQQLLAEGRSRVRACDRAFNGMNHDRWRDEMAVRALRALGSAPAGAALGRLAAGRGGCDPPSHGLPCQPSSRRPASRSSLRGVHAAPPLARVQPAPHRLAAAAAASLPALPQTARMQRRHWRKSNQFFGLTREHAEVVVDDMEVYAS